jgi:hypothetical protein
MDSILNSVKRLCNGITADNTAFDDDIIMYINSIFFNLWQLKIGPDTVFSISDSGTTWDEFLPEDDPLFGTVKIYVGSKVRHRFDPPTNTNVMNALNETIRECEWRMNEEAELR